MKRKNIISLTIGFAFLSIAVTGILLYIKQKSHAAEITHTVFGLIFIGFAIFHIVNNWSSITGYSKERKSGKIQKEFIVAASIFGIILIGGVTEILEPVAEAGRIFAKKRPPRPEALSFEEVKTNQDSKGNSIRVLIEKKKETEMPVVAVWVEDIDHKFVENLYVPAKEAKAPKSEEEAKEGKFEFTEFKPESLPKWQAVTTSKTPLSEKETPHDNFVVNSKTIAKGAYYVILEVKSKDKTEVYEAKIDEATGGLSKLTSKENTLLKSGLVEVL
ncbi:MAG: DUF4405 domain-containing protein [Bacteroidota bacterium]